MAQLISIPAEFQQMAVTRSWLVLVRSQVIVRPERSIRADLLNEADAIGQGWPGEHELSVSRAAMAWSRTRVPSRHRRVSPSLT
jgi:hypothetical protein